MPLSLNNECEMREAQAALFNTNSKSGWILLEYAGPSTVHFSAGGEGTTSEVVPELKDDQIQYGVVRIPNGSQTRDVFFQWIGPDAPILEKGKKTVHLDDAKIFLEPIHAYIFVLNKDKFNDETVLEYSNPNAPSSNIQ